MSMGLLRIVPSVHVNALLPVKPLRLFVTVLFHSRTSSTAQTTSLPRPSTHSGSLLSWQLYWACSHFIARIQQRFQTRGFQYWLRESPWNAASLVIHS
ncbi:hypothetical protein EDD15DRAFT_2304005, partial [Pisolithus albus]